MPHDVHGHDRAVRVRLVVAAAVDHGAGVADQDADGGEDAVKVAHVHGDCVGDGDADGEPDGEPDGDGDAEHVLFVDDHADDHADADVVQHGQLVGDYNNVADDFQDANSIADADTDGDVDVDADANADADDDAAFFQLADNDKHDVADIIQDVHAHAVADAYQHNDAYADAYVLA